MAEQFFLSGKDKIEQFHKELKSLLLKYDAELCIENFGKGWSVDEKIVVSFNWDKDLANKVNSGIVENLIIGTFLNGE